MEDERPARRRIVSTPQANAEKDENGLYMRPRQKSLDDLLEEGLIQIQRIIEMIAAKTAGRYFDREIVTSLKDCMLLLMDLKKREVELLEAMDEAELQALLKK